MVIQSQSIMDVFKNKNEESTLAGINFSISSLLYEKLNQFKPQVL